MSRLIASTSTPSTVGRYDSPIRPPNCGSRLLDAIPPIDDPVYGGAWAGDRLDPDDLLLGYVAAGQAYAYPFKILNFHEIVNDDIDGIPVLISYCPLCRSGIVYDRCLRGETLSFGNTSALYESDLVMVDRTSGSYWWQVGGRAIVGPLTGSALSPLSSTVSTWSDWVAQHPDTLVLTRDTGFDRPYERDSFGDYEAYLDSGQFPFPVSAASRDPRLPSSALVVGVSVGDVTRAYPVVDLVVPINDRLGDVAIVVVTVDGGAAVYEAAVGGQVLEFELSGDGALVDQTGSIWTPDGTAVAGPFAGAKLVPVPTRTTFWFAFVGAFPGAELYTVSAGI